jgi:hypothetical protein
LFGHYILLSGVVATAYARLQCGVDVNSILFSLVASSFKITNKHS